MEKKPTFNIEAKLNRIDIRLEAILFIQMGLLMLYLMLGIYFSLFVPHG